MLVKNSIGSNVNATKNRAKKQNFKGLIIEKSFQGIHPLIPNPHSEVLNNGLKKVEPQLKALSKDVDMRLSYEPAYRNHPVAEVTLTCTKPLSNGTILDQIVKLGEPFSGVTIREHVFNDKFGDLLLDLAQKVKKDYIAMPKKNVIEGGVRAFEKGFDATFRAVDSGVMDGIKAAQKGWDKFKKWL